MQAVFRKEIGRETGLRIGREVGLRIGREAGRIIGHGLAAFRQEFES